MLLDKNLLENGKFTPQLEKGYLLKTISSITEILQGQASLRGIKLDFDTKCCEVELKIDKMRV